MTSPFNRQQLRHTIRQRRQQLSTSDQMTAEHQLDRLLGNHFIFLRSQHIAFYLANDGEINPMQLVQRAWSYGKTCYLPILKPNTDNQLWFSHYSPKTPLVNNKYGILEPSISQHKLRKPWAIDLVLMPLLAFDRHGTRLGMGGGYYDRTFSYLLRQHTNKPYLLGLAHDFQQVDKLTSSSWDVPMNGVATDKHLYL